MSLVFQKFYNLVLFGLCGLPLGYFTFLAISVIVPYKGPYISLIPFLQFGEKEEKVLDCLVFKLIGPLTTFMLFLSHHKYRIGCN